MSRPPFIQVALFVPGDRPDRLAKALGAGADVVIADLEDAVAPEAKEAAREHVARFLSAADEGGPRRWVRVNASTALAELDRVAGVGLHAVMVPKCAAMAILRELGRHLSAIEERLGLPPGSIVLVPLIESAAGVLNARRLARAQRVLTLAFGSLDYGLDMGLPAVEGGIEVLYARSQIAHAALAAGLLPPLDGVWPQVRDEDGTEADARRAYALGMGGKLAIHPGQVAPIRRAFAPKPEDEVWARQVVAAFEEAQRQGLSVVRLGDRFIDPPVVRRAERVLQQFGGAG